MIDLASEFDDEEVATDVIDDSNDSPTKEYISQLEERLAKMEAWQAAVTPTDPASRSAGKKVLSPGTGHFNGLQRRSKSPLNVRTSPTNTPSGGGGVATPASAFSATPGSAASRSRATTPNGDTPRSNAGTPKSSGGGTPKVKTPVSLSKMQWGTLPSKMPDFSEFGDALPPFTMAIGDNENARSGLIAKKLYSQLTGLYAHYSAIKVKYDKQQPLIDGAERKMKNANLKSAKLKDKFKSMKEKIKQQEEQLSGLQSMVDRLNERAMGSMKRLMAAWRNKSLLSCYAAWKSWTIEEKGQKLKMMRFLSKLKYAGVSKCFTNWSFLVAEGKREKILLARFAARWKQMGLYRTFCLWRDNWKESKFKRELARKGELGNGVDDGKNGSVNHEAQWALLKNKGFMRSTAAYKAYDINPSRITELKHEMKLLREENRSLKQTIVSLKQDNVTRYGSPIKDPVAGHNQKIIRNNVCSIVATQKYAAKVYAKQVSARQIPGGVSDE
jgi:hypothetical protein